jgi:hypothetical protein
VFSSRKAPVPKVHLVSPDNSHEEKERGREVTISDKLELSSSHVIHICDSCKQYREKKHDIELYISPSLKHVCPNSAAC